MWIIYIYIYMNRIKKINIYNLSFLFQLEAANQLLQQAQQPHSYLIETVRQRDTQIHTLKDRLTRLEEEVR